jgi:hypothetical protein
MDDKYIDPKDLTEEQLLDKDFMKTYIPVLINVLEHQKKNNVHPRKRINTLRIMDSHKIIVDRCLKDFNFARNYIDKLVDFSIIKYRRPINIFFVSESESNCYIINEIFMKACEENNKDLVKYIIDKDIFVNKRLETSLIYPRPTAFHNKEIADIIVSKSKELEMSRSWCSLHL